MSQPKFDDRSGLGDAEAAAEPQVPVPNVTANRWRFRLAAASFFAWLMYLAWVAMKVVSR